MSLISIILSYPDSGKCEDVMYYVSNILNYRDSDKCGDVALLRLYTAIRG
ncbi:MAG: hypothetical protein AAF349_27230 [Cyanobacteria bacterium P01_A01_bin.68]